MDFFLMTLSHALLYNHSNVNLLLKSEKKTNKCTQYYIELTDFVVPKKEWVHHAPRSTNTVRIYMCVFIHVCVLDDDLMIIDENGKYNFRGNRASGQRLLDLICLFFQFDKK